MRKIFPPILIIFGSFLEIYYYAFRFTQDGVPLWLAIIIGSALTMFLVMLTIIRKKSFAVYFLMVPLFIYSVFCTSAGQTFSLITTEKEQSVMAVQAELNLETIEDLKYQKRIIQTEIEGINKRVNATVGSLEDQYEWKNTYRIATERKQQLEQQLNEINKQLDTKKDTAIISTKREEAIDNENIYHFYGRLSSVDPEIIQLILHGALSLFIAFMAPIGIISLTIETKVKVLKQKTVIKQSVDPQKITRWIQINWTSYRMGKGESILPERVFFKFFKDRNEDFSKKEYDIIKKVAQECNIIDKEKINVYNEIEASRRISEKLK